MNERLRVEGKVMLKTSRLESQAHTTWHFIYRKRHKCANHGAVVHLRRPSASDHRPRATVSTGMPTDRCLGLTSLHEREDGLCQGNQYF